MYNIGLNGSLLLGSQSLNTQQQAIQTIGNNLSNVNTPGYARQRANLVDTSVSVVGVGEQGTGSTVAGVESLRSSLLDNLVQQSLGDQGSADSEASLTATVQEALGENFSSVSNTSDAAGSTSTGAIQDALNNFFGSLQSLAAEPSDSTTRQEVAQDGATVANAISSAYQRVQQAQSEIATDAGSITDQVNQLSKSIASLNQQIIEVQASTGAPPNDLVDTRTADIEQLSQLVNVTTTAQANGSVNVALADTPSVVLVSGINGGGTGSTQSLSISFNPSAATPLTVTASATGSLGSGVPSSGSLGAHLSVADDVIGAPAASGGEGLLSSLDDVANQLRTQMNAQNEAGYDLNGNAGTALFTGTGAADLAFNTMVAASPSLIAAGNGTGALDGSNAQALAAIQNSAAIIPAFQRLVSNLGSQVSTAANNQTTQDQVTQQLQTQRDSVSGVSIDEEMTNLISFQQAYSASARFLTTIADLYDTLINKTS